MKRTVTDERGTRLTLGEYLGGGGQGDVFAAKEGRLAIKIIRPGSNISADLLRRRLERVRRLDLQGLPLARPETVLRPPHIGYTMPLVSGTRALASLIRPGRDDHSPAQWFLNSGGLKGRLRVLAMLARVLHQLHTRGVVYGDLSAENVRISGDPLDDISLHLIDCDNLRVESSPDPTCLYTPGYAAPELIANRSGANTLSDLHAFAVLAHECLTGVHPFLGDVVLGGAPENEERAYAGEFPWIDDPIDRSNTCTTGVPRTRVVSEVTRELFTRAFGPGRIDPVARPRLAEWIDVLEQASDMVLRCPAPSCRATYFGARDEPECPWCGHSLPVNLTLTWLLWDPQTEGKPPYGRLVINPKHGTPLTQAWMRLTAGEPIRLEQRHLGRTVDIHTARSKPIATLMLKSENGAATVCEVTCAGDESLRFIRRGNPSGMTPPEKIVPPGKRTLINLKETTDAKNTVTSRAYLHLGTLETLHRVIRFGSKA